MALLSFDRNAKTILKVDYYAHYERWQDVLQEAKRCPIAHILLTYHTNRALCHTGKLLDEMFSFPQKWGIDGLLLSKKIGFDAPVCLLRISDGFFELGHINEAQHWAHEALSITGDTSWNLQRLVLVNILKGTGRVARNYLSLLDETLFYKNWAEQYRRYIDNDSLLATDQKLKHIRSLMVDSDFVVNLSWFGADLEPLLKGNKQNKMAFEYLMASYLLSGQLSKIVKNIEHLNDFDYDGIPRHLEEALLVYMAVTGQRDINLYGRRIRLNTIKRFQDFQQIFNRYAGNKQAARHELMRKYGDTYWFYMIFQKKRKN